MQKKMKQTAQMKEGIAMEPHIIRKYSEESGHKISKCGFFVSEKYPFLGASPDGMTEDGNLIEIKKVTSKENGTEDETLCRLKIFKKEGSGLCINRQHKYFHQI